MEQVLTRDRVERFLTELGQRVSRPSRLYLLGGSALYFLGSDRQTGDFDYFGHDMNKNDLQRQIDRVASEMGVAVEAVPLDEFVPVSGAAQERHRFVARFGALDIYVFDPYSIALSKLDRGFISDIDDVVFLANANAIELAKLAEVADTALSYGHGFDLDRLAIEENLQVIRNRCA
jgi:hypothetical protein